MYQELIIILIIVLLIMVIQNYIVSTNKEHMEEKVIKFIKPNKSILCNCKSKSKSINVNDDFDFDDDFLYNDDDDYNIHLLNQSQSRIDESHCQNDTMVMAHNYDSDSDHNNLNNDKPLWQVIDDWNEKERYENQEEVDSDFDGIYKDNMYDIDNIPCINKGCTDFATY